MNNHFYCLGIALLITAMLLWISSRFARMRAIAYVPCWKCVNASPIKRLDSSLALLMFRLTLSNSSSLYSNTATLRFDWKQSIDSHSPQLILYPFIIIKIIQAKNSERVTFLFLGFLYSRFRISSYSLSSSFVHRFPTWTSIGEPALQQASISWTQGSIVFADY